MKRILPAPGICLICICIILFTFTSNAQSPQYVPGELLVRIADGKQPASIIRDIQHIHTHLEFSIQEQVTITMNIWKAEFDPATTSEAYLKNALLNHQDILIVQRNHIGSFREREPNDPLFIEQWQHRNLGGEGKAGADIKSTKAWQYTTGGLTSRGDTIVVAVIDDGFFQNHSDLNDNLWKNHREIPGNGIDDDGNGYIDDYEGWNAVSQNGNVYSIRSHGLNVAGIIGAKGNNGEGVSGINWDIKIMQIRLSQVREDYVLRAYEYALTHRKRYNETNGMEGAFVVATNSSWGIDRGRPEDAPLWCAFYDSLGLHGILSAGATANINLNVDIVGDLPTGCNSDFLISVTSTDINDLRNTAAFGRNSIELGAPGSGHVVLNRSNEYSPGGNGTSFATPFVAGSIALLYSAPCSGFAELAISDPAGTALQIRDHILNGVDLIPSLRNITKTGGRLNVYNSMVEFLRVCADCPAPPAPTLVYDESDALQIEWESDTQNIYTGYQLLYRIPGEISWNTVDNVQSPYRLTGLSSCQDYEIALIGICNQETSFESLSTFMRTDGCCEAPREVDTLFVQPNAARVKWRPVLPADYYIMEVFNLTQGTMQTRIELNTEIMLRGLRFCNEYSFRIAAVCNFDTDTTAFSQPFRFTTKGCGSCTETSYCRPGEGISEPVYISRVFFNEIEQESEASESGFEDFRGQVAIAELEESYPITIELDSIPHGPVNVRVWIDYNQDGVFNTANESAVTVNNFEGTMLTRNITIPKNARQGTTRMRVAAWDADLNDTVPTPCAPGGFIGEFEDYCVTIAMRTCPPAIDLDTLDVGFTIVELGWSEIDAAISFVYRYKRTDEETFTEAETTSDNMYLLTGLQPCTSYDFELLTICQFDTSALQVFTFTTACPTNTEEISIEGVTINTFPNPFSNRVISSIQVEHTTDVKIRLLDISGKVMYYENAGKLPPGNHTILMEKVDRFPPGFYLLEFLTDKGNIVKKLVKQ